MHKKQRRQDRDGSVMMARWCIDIAPLTNEPYMVAEVPQYNSYVYLAYATGKWPTSYAYVTEQELHVLNKPYTLHKCAHTKDSVRHCGGVVTQSAEPTRCTMSTTMLKRDLGTGDLCDNIGLVGYVTTSPCHHYLVSSAFYACWPSLYTPFLKFEEF